MRTTNIGLTGGNGDHQKISNEYLLPDSVTSLHSNPLWYRSVLFLFLCQPHFNPEGFVGTLET